MAIDLRPKPRQPKPAHEPPPAASRPPEPPPAEERASHGPPPWLGKAAAIAAQLVASLADGKLSNHEAAALIQSAGNLLQEIAREA